MHARTLAQLPMLVAGLAFALAFVFGAVANRVNFCTMGAITDVVNFGDWRRMRMWLLAIAVAIAGAAALQAPGSIDLSQDDLHRRARSPWLSHLVGGFLFGFGMTLALGLRQQDADPRRRRQPEIARRPGRSSRIAAYMTLQGRCSRRGARTGSIRCASTSALGAATSDLPRARRGAGARRRGEAVAAVRRRGGARRVRVREPRLPRDAAS